MELNNDTIAAAPNNVVGMKMANVKSVNALDTSSGGSFDPSFVQRRSPIDGMSSPYPSFGELNVPDPDVTQRFASVLQEGLMAAGMQPYRAGHLARGFTNILQYLTPAGVAFATGDLTHAASRGDAIGAATSAASLIPTVRPEANAARAAARSAVTGAPADMESLGPTGLLGLLTGASALGIPAQQSGSITGPPISSLPGMSNQRRINADPNLSRRVSRIGDGRFFQDNSSESNGEEDDQNPKSGKGEKNSSEDSERAPPPYHPSPNTSKGPHKTGNKKLDDCLDAAEGEPGEWEEFCGKIPWKVRNRVVGGGSAQAACIEKGPHSFEMKRNWCRNQYLD